MQVTGAFGKVHDFDPAEITMITGPRANDTPPCFYIHGVTPKPFRVIGDGAEFIDILSNKDNFVQFSFAKSGANFWVNVLAVKRVRAPDQPERDSHQTAETVLGFGPGKKPRFITQDLTTARDKIKAAGGIV